MDREQKSAHELVVSKRRRRHREQSRDNPDRPQHEDGYRPLAAVRGNTGSRKQRRKKTQDGDNKSGTEPNSSPPPSRAKQPRHRGKAERQDQHCVHQSVEHDLSDRSEGRRETRTPQAVLRSAMSSTWVSSGTVSVASTRRSISAILVTPVSAMVISSSLRMISIALLTPSPPIAPSP